MLGAIDAPSAHKFRKQKSEQKSQHRHRDPPFEVHHHHSDQSRNLTHGTTYDSHGSRHGTSGRNNETIDDRSSDLRMR